MERNHYRTIDDALKASSPGDTIGQYTAYDMAYQSRELQNVQSDLTFSTSRMPQSWVMATTGQRQILWLISLCGWSVTNTTLPTL